MKALRFLVRYPDGRGEDFSIESETVMIGSGAHCEIRLPVDQSAIEHVRISLGVNCVIAEVRAFEPQPTINGIAFQRSQLYPEAILAIGQVQIKVDVFEVAEKQGVQVAQNEKTSPTTYVLAFVGLGLAAFLLLSNKPGGESIVQPDSPPALWGEPIVSCPVSGKAESTAHATEQERQAIARRERMAFFIQDGVQAVPLFEVVAACYRAAGMEAEAKNAGDSAAMLREEVQREYRTHRVRLDHAIDINDTETMQTETRILLSYTEGKQGEYVTWLSNLDRKLQLQFGGRRR